MVDVPPDNPRLAELRRRVHADPASVVFAQLAEEYRRAGCYQESVRSCRTGLAHHPGYLAARVTLGRSLMELGELDDAAREFRLVLERAPDNLAAIRSLAEIHRRRGVLPAALEYYKRALALARFDSDLEDTVNRIVAEMGIVTPLGPTERLSSEEAIDQLIDFDALLASLGMPDATPPPVMEMLLSDSVAAPLLESVMPDRLNGAADDPFAALEQELRTFARAAPLVQPTAEVSPQIAEAPAQPGDRRAVDELEACLDDRPVPSPNA